ncbi:MAG: hypothetical protein ACLPHI_11155 [Terriglobales bacterium]|jgi:hypothetical protein
MFSWNKSDDRVAMVQLNAELRHAQLELLSAECATNRLRLRFSPEDIARFSERNLLRKAVASATALKEYYSDIIGQIADGNVAPHQSPLLPEDKIKVAIDRMCQYFDEQRKEYRQQGCPLSDDQWRAMSPFFSEELLAAVRIVGASNQRISNPPFYAEAKTLGLVNLPELAQMASLTFEDVVVFPSEINERRLFHALVHVAQFRVLGVERYAELFIRGFLRTHSYVTVPIEMQAFTLEAKFAEKSGESFSVEEIVRLSDNQRRY